MKRLLAALLPLLMAAAAFAQDEGPTDAERQRASIAILLLVILGILLTYGLLFMLRRSGRLPEDRPRDPLQDVKDEVARRSDELR